VRPPATDLVTCPSCGRRNYSVSRSYSGPRFNCFSCRLRGAR